MATDSQAAVRAALVIARINDATREEKDALMDESIEVLRSAARVMEASKHERDPSGHPEIARALDFILGGIVLGRWM